MMSSRLKFGICAWSRWGDAIVDRPDTVDELIVANIVHHLRFNLGVERVAYLQHVDDDAPVFSAETADIRREAWMSFDFIDDNDVCPDLDVVFCRWRWDIGVKDDPRLKMQQRMLARYCNTKTRILIWDDDFQMTNEERGLLKSYDNVTFVETSETARAGNAAGLVYVPYPIAMPDVDDIVARVLPPPACGHGDHLDPNMRVAYVGNNYKRAEFIGKLLGIELQRHPMRTHFYGNWAKYDNDAQLIWPDAVFHPKVARTMLNWVYQHATCVPMLAKDVYFKRGHITPRTYEVVVAGGIPVGFTEFSGVERYYPQQLIARDAVSFTYIVDELDALSFDDRKRIVRAQAEKLIEERIFDVPLFFEQIGL